METVANTLTQQHLKFFDHNLLHKSIQLFYKAINKKTMCSYPGYKVFLTSTSYKVHVMPNPIKDRKYNSAAVTTHDRIYEVYCIKEERY